MARTRVQIVKLNGRYKPCDGCKLRVKCPKYWDFTRSKRYSLRARNTNRVGWCDMWEPGSIRQ